MLYELIPVKFLKQWCIAYYLLHKYLLSELCNNEFIKYNVTSQTV